MAENIFGLEFSWSRFTTYVQAIATKFWLVQTFAANFAISRLLGLKFSIPSFAANEESARPALSRHCRHEEGDRREQTLPFPDFRGRNDPLEISRPRARQRDRRDTGNGSIIARRHALALPARSILLHGPWIVTHFATELGWQNRLSPTEIPFSRKKLESHKFATWSRQVASYVKTVRLKFHWSLFWNESLFFRNRSSSTDCLVQSFHKLDKYN